MLTWIAQSLLRTLESIATHCSVKAKGIYFECCPLFKVTICDLKALSSACVSSSMKSSGNRLIFRLTDKLYSLIRILFYNTWISSKLQSEKLSLVQGRVLIPILWISNIYCCMLTALWFYYTRKLKALCCPKYEYNQYWDEKDLLLNNQATKSEKKKHDWTEIWYRLVACSGHDGSIFISLRQVFWRWNMAFEQCYSEYSGLVVYRLAWYLVYAPLFPAFRFWILVCLKT